MCLTIPADVIRAAAAMPISRELQAMIRANTRAGEAPSLFNDADFVLPPSKAADAVRAVQEMPISRELWAMIDANQRQDLREASIAGAPVYLVPPPPAGELAAANAALETRRRIDEGVRARLRPDSGMRCESCFTLHLRRKLDPDLDGADGFEDLFMPASCGKSSCPFCWRRRLLRSLNRAVGVLLEDAEPDQWAVIVEEPGRPLAQCYIHNNQKAAHQARRQFCAEGKAARIEFLRGRRPHRLGLVHIGETTYQLWPAVDRKMRRSQPHKSGTLRVRRGDDSVLIVSAAPFAGSRPATPAEAAELAAKAIEQMHAGRHSFRLLGSWSDYKPSPWKLVGQMPKPLDPRIVDDEVRALGSVAKRLGKLAALVIRSDTLEQAQAIGQRVEQTLLKSLTIQEESKNGESLPGPSRALPLDPSGALDTLDFDPGDSPWT